MAASVESEVRAAWLHPRRVPIPLPSAWVVSGSLGCHGQKLRALWLHLGLQQCGRRSCIDQLGREIGHLGAGKQIDCPGNGDNCGQHGYIFRIIPVPSAHAFEFDQTSQTVGNMAAFSKLPGRHRLPPLRLHRCILA